MADPNPPPMGPKQKKMVMWYGGAAVVALGVVWWVMRRRASATPSEPNTGYSAATTDTSGYQSSLGGYYDPGTGQFISGVGATGVGTIFGPATNAAWAQQAEAYLTNLGFDAVATAAALGKFLTGQPLSSDQTSIVQSALGFFGAPPASVPPISTAPPDGQTNGRSLFYPPAQASGPGPGQAGGYWWTPSTEEEAADFSAAAYGGNINPGNRESFADRIRAANPQVNWGFGDFRALIGTPMFIPLVTIGGAGSPHTEAPWPLPPGASLTAPSTYHPPS